MTAEQLKPVFEKKYERSAWQNILRENFNVSTLLEKPADITSRIRSNPYNAKAWELGNFPTTDGHLVGIYEVAVADNVQIQRNRKGLRNLLAQVYSTDVEAALLVFIQGNKWRFSYVSEITVKNKETGKREKKTTDPKRFTYLLGEGERAKTAADRFARIKKSEDLFGKGVTLTALEEAFNVEKMSKAFFNEYRKQYGRFTAQITGEDENGKKVKNASPFLKSTFNGDHKAARDFVKKMMGRIVFLYFLEKKGWLGVPADKKWGDGDENFLSNLYNHSKDKKAFYSNVLVPLFFATLNTERKDDNFKIDDKLFTKPGYSKLKIPYLNGGLFEEDETSTQFLVFPEELFANLFTFFDQYNFTVYEDSPDEHTVAVDPEMLGHIFENLLEDNKDKGAFYTPKEIVHYMCRESLIEYLYTKLAVVIPTKEESETREAIEKFVLHHEAKDIIEYDEAILKALKEVKICDPAIGSGAFPMGLLMEIFHLVETLCDASPDVTEKIWELKKGWNPVQVKENIIQNSIYGVDIEKGAVDIARLRFWLSLVVDEDTPKPLPNLDYKIVVGNSLLSKFEDEVIDIDWNIKTKNASAVEKIINDQQAKLHVLQSRQHLYFVAKGDKAKLQKEIRDLKIDVLVNQLTLSRIQYAETNQVQHSAFPTEKEKKKAEEVTEKIRDYNRTIHKLEAIKKHKTQPLEFFDWKLDFPEVMNERIAKGELGFDIVIANPPYIRQEQISNDLKASLSKKYLSYNGRADLYVFFYELSTLLATKKGHLIFISSNKFFRAKYGEGLRKYLSSNVSVKTIIDFGELPVFQTASTFPMIFSAKNIYPKTNDISFTQVESLNHPYPDIKLLAETNSIPIPSNTLLNGAWIFIKNQNSIILEKIKALGKPIKEYKTLEIYSGIKTGLNSAFWIDNEIKKKLIKEAPNSKEIIKQLCRGDDIRKWHIRNSNLFIIYTHSGININQYPAIKGYLTQFRKQLESRAASQPWWQLQQAQYRDGIWEKPKIVFPDICKEPRFTIDYNGIYSDMKGFIIPGNDLSLLGILNSKLIWWFLKQTAAVLGDANSGGRLQLKRQYVENIPICLYDSNFKNLMEDLVVQCLKIFKGNNISDIFELELTMNLMVYKLYNLTHEEACIVEGNTEWMSKEEYEQFKIE